jgi:hypothetical protein
MTFFHVSSHFVFLCTLMISKYFLPVAGNSDFANAQAEQDVFSQSTAGCSSTCKSMSFTSRSRFTRHFQYELSGHGLDSVDSICDLGVVLDSKLNFTLTLWL